MSGHEPEATATGVGARRPDEVPSPLTRDIIDAFEAETDLLRSRLAVRQTLARIASQVASLASVRPLAAVELLGKHAAFLAKAAEDGWGADIPVLVVALRDAWEDCRARGTEEFRSFPARFPEELARRGLALDSSSRHPRYTLDGGLIVVEVSARGYRSSIETRGGARAQMPADVAYVADCVTETRVRLLGRNFDPPAFLGELVAARVALGPAEGPVPVRALAAAVDTARGRKRLILDEFLVDLGLLMTWDGLADSQWVPHLQHTRDASEGVHVFRLERGGLVGMIDLHRGSDARGEADN